MYPRLYLCFELQFHISNTLNISKLHSNIIPLRLNFPQNDLIFLTVISVFSILHKPHILCQCLSNASISILNPSHFLDCICSSQLSITITKYLRQATCYLAHSFWKSKQHDVSSVKATRQIAKQEWKTGHMISKEAGREDGEAKAGSFYNTSWDSKRLQKDWKQVTWALPHIPSNQEGSHQAPTPKDSITCQ